jgi:hypothetical protein
VLEELWDRHSNFHLKEMIVSNTDCELKGEEKEVLRAAHNINDDGVTSVDKGENIRFSLPRGRQFSLAQVDQRFTVKLCRSITRSRSRRWSSKTRVLLKMVLL